MSVDKPHGNKGKKRTAEQVAQNSLRQKGRVFSEEHKQKLSESGKGRSTWNKDKKLDENHKAKIGLGQVGKKRSPEHIARIQAGLKAYWERKRNENG